MRNSFTLEPGTLLDGRFYVVQPIKAGGMGAVYIVQDKMVNDRLCALKQMLDVSATTSERQLSIDRFLSEVQVMQGLNHPGIPKIYSSFVFEQSFFFAMEYIKGQDLATILGEQGNPGLPVNSVVGWALQTLEALKYLHSRKPYPILLGDLKPSNTMITFNGDLKVIDFGVARYFAPSKSPRTFAMVSPGFAPPEKYNRFDCDLRGDIYSLGATLYWALTKANLAKFKFNIPPLRQLKPDANHWLESVLAKCLQYAPERRYSSVDQVRDELINVRKELQGREGRAIDKTNALLERLYKQKYSSESL